jgi:hypothetical protein
LLKDSVFSKKILLVAAMAVSCFAAQGITVSVDSLRINTFGSISNDTVKLLSTASVEITLDSAFIVIDSMDTMVRDDVLQVMWQENLEINDKYYWDLKKCDSNRFRMVRRYSSTSLKPPLFFSAQEPQRRIVWMELGGALWGYADLPTSHPYFFRGTLFLHFGNGQIITLRLYSQEPFSSRSRPVQDKQKLPGSLNGTVAREGNFITVTYGPVTDRASRIGIFDISGKMVSAINLPAAYHAPKIVRFNTTGFQSGWYYVRAISGSSTQTCGSFVINW